MKYCFLVLFLFAVAACQQITPNVTALALSESPSTSTLELKLLAGNLGGIGNLDGAADDARFWNLEGLAVDSAGTVYVGDIFNDKIRKITPTGQVSTFIGVGGTGANVDENGNPANIGYARAIAFGQDGNMYVADWLQKKVLKITPAGVVMKLAGSGTSGSTDGSGISASFNQLSGIAVDSNGNVFVTDGNHTIRKITPSGFVSTFAGSTGSAGTVNGTGTAARFSDPQGLAIDSFNNLYVADTANHAIRKVTAAGVVTTYAGTTGTIGDANGTGSSARFKYPTFLIMDAANNLFVSDSGNHLIRKISPTTTVTTLAGDAGAMGSVNGAGAVARFSNPGGIGVDTNGNVYVADQGNTSVRKVTPLGATTTLAGKARKTGSTNGAGTLALFKDPKAVATNSSGEIFIADYSNHTIRKVSPAGLVTTFAGAPGLTGSSDGTNTGARFNNPQGIAIDASDTIYVADSGNNTIRKITASGVVSTLAGTAGVPGAVDATGTAARFNTPMNLEVDKDGNILVVDSFNHAIRKVTHAGVVTTLAGSLGLGGSGDGLGNSARFQSPTDIAIDSQNNAYVTDSGNYTLRKITPTGLVTTIAGVVGLTGSTDGPFGTATFEFPKAITISSDDILFVADDYNYTIRKVTLNGTVKTVVGTQKERGVKIGVLPATLNEVGGIAFHDNKLYITSEDAVLECSKP